MEMQGFGLLLKSPWTLGSLPRLQTNTIQHGVGCLSTITVDYLSRRIDARPHLSLPSFLNKIMISLCSSASLLYTLPASSHAAHTSLWVPQDARVANVIGNCSYNELIAKLTTAESAPSAPPPVAAAALASVAAASQQAPPTQVRSSFFLLTL